MTGGPAGLDGWPPFEGFPPEGFSFLRRLKRNNNREWFAGRKAEYEECVKRPMESLVHALSGPIRAFAPEILVDPKRSIFRIYRDTRFSNNKEPYKTNVGAIFHPKGKWQEGAGFYLHLEPGQVFVAGGIYMPDGRQLKRIRAAIAAKPKDFLGIVESRAFRKQFGEFRGEKLSRAPLGYRPDHPMIEWLKFKQYIVWLEWEESAALGAGFVRRVADVFRGMLPLVRFVNKSLHR